MPNRLSVQLYSLRREASRDFPGVLDRLGRIGYSGVEPAGLHDLSAAEFRRHVEDAGMVVSSAHSAAPRGEAANQILDLQQEIGNDTLVVPFLPSEVFADRGSIQKAADEMNEAIEVVRPRGMSLGYHNHWWEFTHRVGDRSAHAVFFDLLDPAIFAEVDVYWAQVGGADPAATVTDLGPRARLLHVKDGPADDPEAAMTAVGDGVLDIPAILAAGEHAEWHVVELDRCDSDMFEAVESSHAYLTSRELSRGRT